MAIVVGATALQPAIADAARPRGGAQGSIDAKRLLKAESRVLGAAHAAEHARQSAAMRSPRVRARLQRSNRLAPRARLRAAGDPAQDGQWAAPFVIPDPAVHSILLATGKVLWIARTFTDVDAGFATLWDPATNTFKSVNPPVRLNGKSANIFCAGQTLLPDGRVLMMGGTLANPDRANNTDWKGLNAVYTFNPFSETWTKQPDMADGRWYPTQVLLPDGRTIVMDGLDASGVKGAPHNNDIEVFAPSTALDGIGTVSKIATRGGAGQPPTGGFYPNMYTMPSGRVLVAGPRVTDSWWINSLTAGQPFSWSDAPDPARASYTSGVILPSDSGPSTTVALTGGGNEAGRQNQVFDEANPGWVSAPPLSVVRNHHNTVLLPDGSMVAVGGGVGTVNGTDLTKFEPENLMIDIYDPADRTWRLGPAQAEGRAYHSTAQLLPDGRVLSAGDDTAGGNTGDTGELYSPAYLFRGARPVIGAAPSSISYGQDFTVGYGGSDVAKAVLVAPGATTHGHDMSQRYVRLAITANANGAVTLAPPAQPAAAPPSYYMLFLLNAQGVPSVAKFVQLGGEAAPPPPITPPVPPPAPGDTALPPAPPDTTPPPAPADTTPPPAPALSPASGILTETQPITMTTNEAGATIKYTVAAGTSAPANPTATSGKTYRAPVEVGSSGVVKAVAVDAAGNTSSVTQRAFAVAVCVPKRPLRVSVQRPKGVRFAQVEVYVNGKSVKRVSRRNLGSGTRTKAFSVKLPQRRISKVTIVARTTAGKKLISRKAYKPCR